MTLDFWQIVYKDEQRKHCYPFARIFHNGNCTQYFENTPICELVPNSRAAYIGVASWRLRHKRTEGWTPVILKNEDLTEERILSNDFDIAILTPVDPEHEAMCNASAWHGSAWTNAIAELRKFIPIPDELKGNVIYGNHFIARREIYQQYVSECLAPVIAFMEGKEVFRAASGYWEKKVRPYQQGTKEAEELAGLLRGWGMSDYPISVFVLERLFRIWIEGRRYRIINL